MRWVRRVLLCVLVGVLAISTAGFAITDQGMQATSATQLNELFNAYGDTSGRWNGGDSTASVPLPDGRVAWLFSDTYIGNINTDGSRPGGTPMIHNSIVVQDDDTLMETLTGGTEDEPRSLVGSEIDGKPGNAGYWVADGTVEGSALRVLYNHYQRTGSHSLSVRLTKTVLATFSLPGLTLTSVKSLPLGDKIAWGSAILETSSHTYIYGTGLARESGFKPVYLARVPSGGIAGGWQFWTGDGWSQRETEASRQMTGVTTAFSVHHVNGQYVLLTVEGHLTFNSDIVAYTSNSPSGPFKGPVHLYRAPEPKPGKEIIVYDARAHLHLSDPGKLLISYNVNSLDGQDNLADASLYRPRFLEIDWPPPEPDPATVPRPPDDLTATGEDAGKVNLTWKPADGALKYWIYQRDVAGGQSHFVRLPSSTSTPSVTLESLKDGHLYEFKVTAANANGEGKPTGVVSEVSRSEPVEEGTYTKVPDDSVVRGEYLVDLRDNAAIGEYGIREIATRLLNKYGGTLEHLYSAVLGGFSTTEMTESQARELATDPAVEIVEENRTGDTNDHGRQEDASWNLDYIDGEEDGTYIYPATGAGVKMYVIDTGIRATHEDFGGRAEFAFSVWENTDDMECKAHGTHVAGIAGGVEFGVAKDVNLIDVQAGCAVRPTPFESADLVKGADWVAEHGDRPAVVNMSAGISVHDSRKDLLKDAVQDSIAQGITYVTSAGNEAQDACEKLPASMSNVITVAAVDQDYNRAGDDDGASNFGRCVDIFAPGASILSAGSTDDGATERKSGTSMAAPHVAGAAAMVLEHHPNASPAEVKAMILGAAVPDKIVDPGPESPNLFLRVDPPLLEAPQNLTATPNDDGTIALSWDPVETDGVHYLVSSRDVTAGQEEFKRWENPVDSGTTATAKDLVPDHTYEFRVAAASAMAVSPESNVARATSYLAKPDAPSNLTAEPAGNGTIKLSWSPPDPPDVWYLVYQRDVTLGEEEFTKLPLPITDGTSMVAQYLEHGHVYEFKVSATNEAGEGPASEPARAAASYDLPKPPTDLQAERGDGEVTLTWEPSPTKDTWYWVYQRNASENEEWERLPLPISNCCEVVAKFLANGDEYEFKVTAINQGGESAPSNIARSTPMPPPPGTPTNLRAEQLDSGDIKLTWDEPGEGLYYWVYWRDVTAGEDTFRRSQHPTEKTSATWGNLTHQHIYEFKVTATNIAGESDPAFVRATSRVTKPAAPTNLRAVATGGGEIELTWDAPRPDVYYYVYWRDITEGENTFKKSQYPTDKPFATWGYLTHGHTYEFKVTAINAAGEGPASTTTRATAVNEVPQPPTNLRATPGDGQVRLSWTASPSKNIMYMVYQRNVTKNKPWKRLPIPISDCCSMTAKLLVNGDTYNFKVTAANDAGESKSTNVASAKPMPPSPQAPTNPSASPRDGAVRLNWSASPTPGVWYLVDHRKAGGSWKRMDIPIKSCCSVTMKYLTNGTTYEFRVRATNLAGLSGPSNVARAKPMPPFPQAPANLRATPLNGKVKLNWSASPTRGVYYLIDHRKVGGTWQRMKYPVQSCCSITMKYLTNGTTYEFRVRATNLSGVSSPSNTARARPMPPFPKPPSRLRAIAGDAQVRISWSASPTSGVYYNVYQRDATLNGWWEKLPYPIKKTSMTAKYLGNGHKYNFKVTAINLSGESEPSNVVTAMPRFADGTTRSTSITSSWIGGIRNPTQLFNITGKVRGTRSGNYIRIDGSWRMNNDKRLLDGGFWYLLIDCSEGILVAEKHIANERPPNPTSGSISFSHPMNPQNTYKVQVWGGGDITHVGAIYGQYSPRPPGYIIPFRANSSCF